MKRVLFVCVANAGRSQIAEGYAKHFGGQVVEAWSAGSNPARIVAQSTIEVMQEDGIDIKSHTSKGLDEVPAIEYDYVVTMGCGDNCPTTRAKQRIDWQIKDPKECSLDEVRRIRDQIKGLVKELLSLN